MDYIYLSQFGGFLCRQHKTTCNEFPTNQFDDQLKQEVIFTIPTLTNEKWRISLPSLYRSLKPFASMSISLSVIRDTRTDACLEIYILGVGTIIREEGYTSMESSSSPSRISSMLPLGRLMSSNYRYKCSAL